MVVLSSLSVLPTRLSLVIEPLPLFLRPDLASIIASNANPSLTPLLPFFFPSCSLAVITFGGEGRQWDGVLCMRA